MRSAHATWRPVPYTGLHRRQPHRAVLCHTNGGGTDNGSLFGWWSSIAKKGQHIGAHFQIATSGHAEQYVDTDEVVYHAYGASEWAVGIETEDDSHPSTPWTDAQIETIILICHELHVPGRLLTSAQPADGLGWHEMFHDWNHDGHQCPGHVREQQIRSEILPALLFTRNPYPQPDFDRHHIDFEHLTTTVSEPVKWVQWALHVPETGKVDRPSQQALIKFKTGRHLPATAVVDGPTGRGLATVTR